MSYPRNSMLAAALMAAASVSTVQGQGAIKIESIIDYNPLSPTDDFARIALDVDQIKQEVQFARAQDAFEKGFEVYSKGGYSHSIAKIQLRTGIDFFIDEGTVFTGPSTSQASVTATAMQDYTPGDTIIQLLYHQDIPCHVGGLQDPQMSGCFLEEGLMTISGRDVPYDYYYNPQTDNLNDDTLQGFALNVENDFRLGAKNKYWFPEFLKFSNYYGTQYYMDRLMSAAFRGTAHQFDNHLFDFSGWGFEDRAFFVEKGASFLLVGMHILSQLEQAFFKCEEGCGPDVCNFDSIDHLDAAVAYYTGSLYENFGGGNMLYGLADEMCTNMKTCGWRANELEGRSHVNLMVFAHFKELQGRIAAGKCDESMVDYHIIVKQIFIPMWQALLWYTFEGNKNTASLFASGTLPILHNCTPHYTEKLANYYAPKSGTIMSFDKTLEVLQKHYHCLRLSCFDVGGVWDKKKNRFYKRGKPCKDHTKVTEEDSSSFLGFDSAGSAFALLGVVFLSLCCCGSCLLYRRKIMRLFSRKEKTESTFPEESFADTYTDNSANIATGEAGTFT